MQSRPESANQQGFYSRPALCSDDEPGEVLRVVAAGALDKAALHSESYRVQARVRLCLHLRRKISPNVRAMAVVSLISIGILVSTHASRGQSAS